MVRRISKQSERKNLLKDLRKTSKEFSSFKISFEEYMETRGKETFSQMFFLMGISAGFFLNITASIMYELIRESKALQIGAMIVSLCFILLISYLINRIYVRPYKDLLEISRNNKKIEKEIENVAKLIEKI